MRVFEADRARYRNLATAWVTPEPRRCVQCGVCSFNCPMGLDVRRQVWRGEPVGNASCITCGECVRRCPRSLLRFEPIGRHGSADPPRDGRQSTAAGGGRLSGAGGTPTRRYVLVGGGPATVAAAEAIRAADAAARIVVVCDDPHGYYSRPGLAYLLTDELARRRLFPAAPDELRALGIDWVAGRAAALETAAHRVVLESGRVLEYDRLLLATGSAAIGAGVPGADLDGVVKLDGLDDALGIIRRARSVRDAVVVGGGITALEIVEGLRAQGLRVHYFLRRERYWANVLSAMESRVVEERLRREGVVVHRFTELAEILGSRGRVTGVRTGDDTVIPCGLVAVAVGVRPRVELARAAGLACARGVLVDDHLRTSDADIYAAGDIAEVADPRTGRRVLDVLWNVAAAKGRVAGLNMATATGHPYPEERPLNVTRLAGLHTTIIGAVGNGEDADLQGLARGDSQVWSELGEEAVVEAERGEAHVRLALGDQTIEGAVVMGDQSLSWPLQELIETRAVAGEMEDLDPILAGVVCEARDDWRACRVRA
jgi:NAD(P)H-nitrite reductase large subunit/NAD-dependent dihydropyrimidine dehydrogenase PreA subunit